MSWWSWSKACWLPGDPVTRSSMWPASRYGDRGCCPRGVYLARRRSRERSHPRRLHSRCFLVCVYLAGLVLSRFKNARFTRAWQPLVPLISGKVVSDEGGAAISWLVGVYRGQQVCASMVRTATSIQAKPDLAITTSMWRCSMPRVIKLELKALGLLRRRVRCSSACWRLRPWQSCGSLARPRPPTMRATANSRSCRRSVLTGFRRPRTLNCNSTPFCDSVRSTRRSMRQFVAPGG